MVDFATIEGVESGLSRTPFAASSVTKLSGGYCNFTYRITLRKPYAQAGLEVPVRTLILKHAKPYVAISQTIPFTVERQDIETMAFKYVPQLTMPLPVVSLPKLYHQDSVHCAILMSDSGEASTTLKALLQATPPNEEVSHVIGLSLGTFLGRLHNSTSGVGSPGRDIKAAFAANQQGRFLSGFFTYGRLVDTLSPQDGDQGLIEPPLNLSPAEIERVATLAKTMQDRIMTSEDVLTMGDFWSGNLIVSFVPELRVDVVDWEAAKPGLAGLDIGQFLAEMYLLHVFHPASRASVDAIVSSFLRGYREVFLIEDSVVKQNLTDVARVAATHLGTHLITWAPRTPWGNKDQMRAVVVEGVEYLFRSLDADEVWLRTSLVGGLWL